MKRILYCILTTLISLTLFSCLLLSRDLRTIENKNNENEIYRNVKIYIDNRSNETINVHSLGNAIPLLLARILPGTVELINIRKGTIIYLNSENPQRQPREIICDEDQKTYFVY